MNHWDYAGLIERELIPHVEWAYRTGRKRDHLCHHTTLFQVASAADLRIRGKVFLSAN
jgi:hypothetical protein